MLREMRNQELHLFECYYDHVHGWRTHIDSLHICLAQADTLLMQIMFAAFTRLVVGGNVLTSIADLTSHWPDPLGDLVVRHLPQDWDTWGLIPAYPQRRNGTTSMVGLKKMVRYTKISPKLVNFGDKVGNAEGEEKDPCFPQLSHISNWTINILV